MNIKSQIIKMVYVNEDGFLERSTRGGRRNPTSVGTTRDWWLIKASSKPSASPQFTCGIPWEYLGKRVKVKLVVLDENSR